MVATSYPSLAGDEGPPAVTDINGTQLARRNQSASLLLPMVFIVQALLYLQPESFTPTATSNKQLCQRKG